VAESPGRQERGAMLKKIMRAIKRAFGLERFLCDKCRYDYRGACSRPERPNATECRDYKPRS